MGEKGKAPGKPGAKGGPKEVMAVVKLQIEAGKANPAPPIGPALGQHGVNIMEFCKAYNEKTKDKMGQIIPVVLTVFNDRSFEFKLKSPPASELIKKALNLPKGSGRPNKDKLGKLNRKQLLDIAKQKVDGLNSYDDEAAIKMIAGTARSMGVDVDL